MLQSKSSLDSRTVHFVVNSLTQNLTALLANKQFTNIVAIELFHKWFLDEKNGEIHELFL